MNDLFVPGEEDDPAAFRPDEAVPAHHRVTTIRERRDHLSGALDELAADVVVVEGPNRTKELQLFFDEDVEGEWLAGVQVSKGVAQCVGVAVCADEGRFENPPFEQFDTSKLELFSGFLAEPDNGIDDQYGFERRPYTRRLIRLAGKASASWGST